jgi:hypothetical protein
VVWLGGWQNEVRDRWFVRMRAGLIKTIGRYEYLQKLPPDRGWFLHLQPEKIDEATNFRSRF